MSRSEFRYQSQKCEDPKLINEILKIKIQNRQYGLPRVYNQLRRRGFEINKKKVHRLMRALNLLVKAPKKRRSARFNPEVKSPVATRANHVWAIDFVFTRLQKGTSFRVFTVVDTFTRVCPLIFISTSMAEQLPMKILNQLKERGTKPEWIISDNGPEFSNFLFQSWAKDNGILLHFIDPGEPTQNGYIESFNGKFRDECLNQNQFTTLAQARRKIEEWRKHYNEERPHSSLDYLTPKEFAEQELSMLANPNNALNKWY